MVLLIKKSLTQYLEQKWATTRIISRHGAGCNGQYSVSYTDMHGRTVATALAGAAPDSMDALPTNMTTSITQTLSDPGSNVTKDLVMESKKGLLVEKKVIIIFIMN